MEEEWKPGSFTKNFSWGDRENGLLRLHEIIRLGFDGKIEDVSRSVFRDRVANAGRPDYIPLNFFLFNAVKDGLDVVLADELVFQALTREHSPRFDKLALFAFNFSYVGRWKGASKDQRRPALWSTHYVADRIGQEYQWRTDVITADDIETFVSRDPRYKGKTTRKLATNLNYLYKIGRLAELSETKVDRWWVDALFLALDRLIEDRKLDGLTTSEGQHYSLLERSTFKSISGRSSIEKDLALKHLVSLYSACGSRDRFSEQRVQELQALSLPDVAWLIANDPDTRPQGAVDPTNPRVLKTIPRACAMLARYKAGFEVISADELSNFDAEIFVREHTLQALLKLRANGVKPTMSADELLRVTRAR